MPSILVHLHMYNYTLTNFIQNIFLKKRKKKKKKEEEAIIENIKSKRTHEKKERSSFRFLKFSPPQESGDALTHRLKHFVWHKNLHLPNTLATNT